MVRRVLRDPDPAAASFDTCSPGSTPVEENLCRNAAFAQRPALPTSVEDAEPLRPKDRLGAVASPDLAVERAGVVLDRVRREVEPLGDLAVGRARRDHVEHLPL